MARAVVCSVRKVLREPPFWLSQDGQPVDEASSRWPDARRLAESWVRTGAARKVEVHDDSGTLIAVCRATGGATGGRDARRLAAAQEWLDEGRAAYRDGDAVTVTVEGGVLYLHEPGYRERVASARDIPRILREWEEVRP